MTEIYLETGAGDSIEDVSLADIQNAIAALPDMDDEHGAFWVVIFSEDGAEKVLEVDKNKQVIATLQEGQSITAHFDTWPEIEALFARFFDEAFDDVKALLTAKL